MEITGSLPRVMAIGRSRPHTTVGLFAMTAVAVATVALGARTIGVSEPPDALPMFCPVPGQCVQHVPPGPDLDVPFAHR